MTVTEMRAALKAHQTARPRLLHCALPQPAEVSRHFRGAATSDHFARRLAAIIRPEHGFRVEAGPSDGPAPRYSGKLRKVRQELPGADSCSK